MAADDDVFYRSNIPRRSLFNSSPSSFVPTPTTPTPAPALLTLDSSRPIAGDPSSALDPPSSPEDPVRSTVHRRRIPRVEKDVDDPTTPVSAGRYSASRQQSTTLTTLSRLFAVQSVTSPTESRLLSDQQIPNTFNYPSASRDTALLHEHLYSRGLLGGRHSDITLHAFNYPYKVHRIILDRAPFFSSALSGPWLESNAKEMDLHPEDIDSNITQVSFELALKRLYGASNPDEEDAEAVGLFATACWLEMPDLIESSIESMLRQMSTATLSPLIKLVTNNYYGRSGDKILASAKAMLCRDGWKMPIKYWDGIPGDIIREIVGGDGFFINGEWDRWVLAKRLLDRHLKILAMEAGLVDPRSWTKVLKAPETVNLMAVRFDTVYRKNAMTTCATHPEGLHRWISLYTHHDIEPLLVLLDEGIHYIHLDFEQLQFIRRSRDILGLPMMPDKVISNALWMQMELRQKVLNAQEKDMELGLSQTVEETHASQAREASSPESSGKGKGKSTSLSEALDDVEDEDIPSNSWDGNGKPRKFWIPSADCNVIMGASTEAAILSSPNPRTNRLSATIQPEDVQWASDFAAITSDTRAIPQTVRPNSAGGSNTPEMRPVCYSHFPPFRFAVEFPSPRLLKEKKRVYSRTIFYCGSWWNLYIQKVRRGKNPQLGVYLHRAKERETDDVLAAGPAMAQGNVDERIGHLEREMLLRADRRAVERRRMLARRRSGEVIDGDGADSNDSTDPDGAPQAAEPSTRPRVVHNSPYIKSSHTDVLSNSPPKPGHFDEDADSDSEDPEIAKLTKNMRVPTLPPYVDARPTIKTYFKIYSPSKGGRMLSVYESAPDTFNFSQSWGWKSSTLMLDDGLFSSEPSDEAEIPLDRELADRSRQLRFMIVIGNV